MLATSEYILCVVVRWIDMIRFENWAISAGKTTIAVIANSSSIISGVRWLACRKPALCRLLQIFRCYYTVSLLGLRNLLYARDVFDRLKQVQNFWTRKSKT